MCAGMPPPLSCACHPMSNRSIPMCLLPAPLCLCLPHPAPVPCCIAACSILMCLISEVYWDHVLTIQQQAEVLVHSYPRIPDVSSRV